MDLLSHITEVDEEKISLFRNKLNPELTPIFDKADEVNKKILTAIDSLSKDELAALKQQAKNSKNLVGFHDVNNHLAKLLLLTDDKKYLN